MEKKVIIKQNPILAISCLIIIGLIFCSFAITAIVMAENKNHLWIAICFFIATFACFFFAITAKLFIKSKDIYTEKGMVRMRGNKVLYELEWHNVAKIQYNKLSLMSILMFGPTAFLIFQKEPPKDKKQARTFLTYYSMKEVKKIQTIIPIEIQY